MSTFKSIHVQHLYLKIGHFKLKKEVTMKLIISVLIVIAAVYGEKQPPQVPEVPVQDLMKFVADQINKYPGDAATLNKTITDYIKNQAPVETLGKVTEFVKGVGKFIDKNAKITADQYMELVISEMKKCHKIQSR